MNLRRLLISAAILTVLAGVTVTSLTAQQRRGPGVPAVGVQLTEAEENYILYMREEEKLARDVYLALYEVWGAEIFANISESEQRHMDALQTLITRYGLVDPVVDDTLGTFTNPDFGLLYDQFVTDGSESLETALGCGAYIEELDIADLEAALGETSTRSVRRVFENLLNGSYNHLSAFEQSIETGTTEWPGQPGQNDGTCTGNQDRNMINQGGGNSGNGAGQGANGPN